MPNGNLVSWGALSVRSAIFTNAFDAAKTDEVYVRAFGQQPSNYQGPPPGIPFAPSQASGFLKVGQATVQKFPGRIDFFISPAIEQPDGLTPTIKEAGDALDLAVRVASQMSKSEAALGRLALLADFGRPAESVAEANKLILEIIPHVIQITDEMDFTLQLTNRTDSHSVPGVKLNSLKRWAVAQVQQFAVPNFGMGNAPHFGMPGAGVLPVSTHYMAQLTLDINTVPEGAPIAGASAGLIFHEMREMIDAVRPRDEG